MYMTNLCLLEWKNNNKKLKVKISQNMLTFINNSKIVL